MGAGALAELLTLAMIIPFIAVLSNPTTATSYPLLQSLVSSIGWTDAEKIILPTSFLFALVTLSAGVIRFLLAWKSQRFVFNVGHDLSVAVYRRTLSQPYLYHTNINSSGVIAATAKVDVVVYGVLLQLMQLITSVVLSASIIAALMVINPIVTLAAAFGFGVVYVGIVALVRRRVQVNSTAWANAQGERIKSIQEGFGGIRDVLVDQTQESFVRRFAAADSALRQAQGANALIGAAPRYLVEACGMVLIAVLALALSHEGGLNSALPILAALAVGAQKLLPLLQSIYNGWTNLAGHRQSLVDVLAVLDLPIEPDDVVRGAVTPISFKRDIVLERVSFQYDATRPVVVRDLSIRIEKGSRVGFIGQSGSGKSTVVDLVMGLLPPTSGHVKIDGLALTSDNIRSWQTRIAHVPQAIYLADATITSNIAFGVAEKDVDFERLRDVVRQAELADFVETLPNRYGTVVGERGIRLSGGQRQRIGIARALYKGASVLIFDEATNTLDNETEAAVMKAIRGLRRDLTILIISHRLSTMEVCDKIIRLKAGRIVGEGTYADMVSIERRANRLE